MIKRVLDVGNCGPDFAAIRSMIEAQFGAQVVQADALSDALELLRTQTFDLVLVNRKLDCDYSDGIEIIRQLKTDSQWSQIPVMLVTNYEQHQQQALQLGALRGFGKLALQDPETHQRLAQILA